MNGQQKFILVTMNKNNLKFNEEINKEIREWAFDLLFNFFNDFEGEIFVKNLMMTPDEILFFVVSGDDESIIRLPFSND